MKMIKNNPPGVNGEPERGLARAGQLQTASGRPAEQDARG